jgi:hypothetical protein
MKSVRSRTRLWLGSLGFVIAASLTITCTQLSNGHSSKDLQPATAAGHSAKDLQPATAAATSYHDLRSFQHGLDFLKQPSGSYYAIFSSNNLPPTDGSLNPGGNWNHDIYFANVSATSPTLGPGTGTNWISATEAQEPASSAINASSTKILCTWEDGNPGLIANSVGQVCYVSSLPLTSNPYSSAKVIYDGGHSGHAAAVGENFVVFWCDNWTNHGGVDNLGSGNDNYVSTVSSTGTIGPKLLVSTGRTWWPVVSGSATKACLLWQKFIKNQLYSELHCRLFDPAAGTMTSDIKLQTNQLYYHYSVKYIPAIDRFLIMASKDGGAGINNGRKCAGGSAWLIDGSGSITATANLPDGIIRESHSIVSGTRVVQARLKAGNSVFGSNSNGGATGGVVVIDLTPSAIALAQTIDDTYAWYYMGNDGFFIDATHVFVAGLSTSGMYTKTYTINP